jgi:hypothetical protein
MAHDPESNLVKHGSFNKVVECMSRTLMPYRQTTGYLVYQRLEVMEHIVQVQAIRLGVGELEYYHGA